ncbi:hypothetical protein [Hymenobacter sp. CRA2]|uniref:hypothetical protein n=1 Tax=Hymenobacter sp. CRA2 TaxID=1955620 RepID=UPI0009901EFB|nr:hypothetical protein [Hymenobacter sp. CRA2]OON67256.1 hypothetical protein B0919_19205 [Hymenobacter sp. CRA2]
MKKLLLLPVLALFALSAQAQTFAAQTPEQPHTEKTHTKRVKPAKTEPAKTEHAEDGENGGATVGNHGQDVSAVAASTTLTGADKGAAISAVARTKRNGSNNAADVARAPQRSARGRSTTGGHAHASASSHGATHRATAGHRGH